MTASTAESSPLGDRPVVIVTGATGGIGRAIVHDLVRDHDVIAVGRSAEALARFAKHERVTTWQADLRRYADLAKLVTTLPRLDAIVHAAAVGNHYSLQHSTPSLWEDYFATNVIAPAELTRLALPLLRRSKGTVVFIGSGASTRPVPGSIIVAATKHALKAVADTLRIEEAEHGIRVSTVSPGQTDTPMLQETTKRAGRVYEAERYIRPESIAAAVRFVLDATPDAHLADVSVRPRTEVG